MAPKKKVEEKPRIKWGRPGNTLKMGLVGLPNVGKSTTFNLLTKMNIPAENFPFCTIDPHEAVVKVPDERFDWLCGAFKPKSEVAAVLKIWDIAGLVPKASEGEGLGNAFLANITAVDGIFHVCRAFSGEEDGIVHTEGEVDPIRDLQIIRGELIAKDLAHASKQYAEAHRKYAQNQKLKDMKDESEALKKAVDCLEAGTEIRLRDDWTAKDVDILRKYQFLTSKPAIYLVNLSAKDYARKRNKHLKPLHEWIQANGHGPMIPYSAEFELGYASCTTDDERKAFLSETGADKSMLDKIIQTGYDALDLQHFFTCGPDEVRCWTIPKHCKAPQAAGTIHTDMERGFICAECYSYADVKELGSEAEVKAKGKMRQQGKEYEVQDGDILFIKFNVTTKKK